MKGIEDAQVQRQDEFQDVIPEQRKGIDYVLIRAQFGMPFHRSKTAEGVNPEQEVDRSHCKKRQITGYPVPEGSAVFSYEMIIGHQDKGKEKRCFLTQDSKG